MVMQPRSLPIGHGELLLLVDDEIAILHLGKAILEAHGYRVVTTSNDKTARVWDIKGGAEAFTFKGHDGRIRSATFRPDGTIFTSGLTSAIPLPKRRQPATLRRRKPKSCCLTISAYSLIS